MLSGSGAILKTLSGFIVFGFLVYSLYFNGTYHLSFLKGVLALILLFFFVSFASMIPFGTTFSPIFFEWWWHDIPFWHFTTAAWVVTAISMAANILLVAGMATSKNQD